MASRGESPLERERDELRFYAILLWVGLFSSAAEVIESDPNTSAIETDVARSVLMRPSSLKVELPTRS